jgi:hypothetical protein
MNVNFGNVTTSLRSLWEELLERRLWPIAVALVVAIIAVPVLLSKPAKTPAPVPPPPAANSGDSPAVAFQPAVSTEGRKSSEIRKDLRRFTRKNPFTPQGLSISGTAASGTAEPTGTAAGDAVTAGATGGESFAGGSAVTDTGSSGGDSGSSGSPTPTPGTTTQTFYYHYTAKVRFGKTGQEDAKTLKEFRALPSSDNPVIVFMGIKNDGETAVFLISADSSVTGDGNCKPSDTACTLLYMKKNDKETIEAVNADQTITQYTLELRAIEVERTEGPEKASGSSTSSANLRHERRNRFRRIVRNVQSFGL